jgi:hypothetical protein
VFALSSLRALVWSAFLIGRMRCVSCFNRLVAFQSEYSVSAVAVKLRRCVWNVSLVLFSWSLNFLVASLYLRLSLGCWLISHVLLSFRFPLIWTLTFYGYSGYLARGSSSGVALQADFFITLLNSIEPLRHVLLFWAGCWVIHFLRFEFWMIPSLFGCCAVLVVFGELCVLLVAIIGEWSDAVS